jgi:hypothetical protein
MHRPADLAGRVGDAVDREVHVADDTAGVACALDRELPDIAIAV